MDALSLSHLTYCCATITVNFHRLDHPPFPCKSRLLLSRIGGKPPERVGGGTSTGFVPASHRRSVRYTRTRGSPLHEATNYRRNPSHRSWHHRIRHRRNLLHPPEKRCRPRSSSDLPQDPGHPSTFADFQHRLRYRRPRSGRSGSKGEIRQRFTASPERKAEARLHANS
jgi:hypothetical protein